MAFRRLLTAALLLPLTAATLVSFPHAAAETNRAVVIAGPSAVAAPDAPQTLAISALGDLRLKDVQNALLPGSITNDRGMLLGGVGSDLFRRAKDPVGEYWMVTDRGPNGQIAVAGSNRRTFPVPEFDPLIVRVKTDGSTVTLLQTLPILTQSGAPVTGLSNLTGADETPYDFSAQTQLSFNVNGLDTEGIVRTAAGDFWLIEEYRPSIVHIGADGKVIKRFIPVGVSLPGAGYPVAATLPAIYDKRKSNRGFEGVAISPDDKTLFIVLQSPLSNPNKNAGEASRNTRILVFDIASEQVTAEYAYRFEEATVFDPSSVSKAKPSDEMKLSGVIAQDTQTLVVLERTDVVAKLYRVDLSQATNILGTKWDELATTPSFEQLSDFAAAGITPVAKGLAVNLSAAPGMPGKIEGFVQLGLGLYAVANDNDFDIGSFDASGNNVGTGAKSQILVVSTQSRTFAPFASQ